MRTGTDAGFGMLELLIATVILGMVAGVVALVTQSTSRAYRTGATVSELESEARHALDEIIERIKSSSSDQISPTPEAEFYTSQVDFVRGIRLEDNAIVWGDPERIDLQYSPTEINDGTDDDGNGLVDEGWVVWTENPGLPDERSITLCRDVSEYLEGETFNGLDDNGNGLIDERGLSFDFEENSVNVRLTLQQLDSEDVLISRTVQRTVSFRNKGH